MQGSRLKLSFLILFLALGARAQNDVPPPEIQEVAPSAASPAPSPAPAPEAQAQAADAPSAADNSELTEADRHKEERFHKIYKTYNAQPTSAEEWEKVLSQRKVETYRIQKNDTLWDLSRTLFGDNNYWPKVWSYNTDDILNPHEINPNQVLKFYPGTLAEAPTVGLADKKDAPEALPQEVIEKTPEGTLENIKIPPPKHKSPPVVKHLPKSLPLYRMGAVNRPPPEIDTARFKRNFQAPEKYLVQYVAEGPVPELGEVVEVEGGGKSAGDFQYVIVQVKDASAHQQYYAVKDTRKVSDPFEPNSASATVIEVQGNLELQEKVNQNLYRALITKVINPLEVGAKLVPGSMPLFETAETPVANSAHARIIGGVYQRATANFYGNEDFVFLNAGTKEGLQVGNSLNVFLNERLRNPETKALENDRNIGVVKIIKATEHFATGYVENASFDILLGDYIGSSGAVVPKASASGESKELDLAPSDSGSAPAAEPQSGTPNDEDLQL